jgi:hypothetical protein
MVTEIQSTGLRDALINLPGQLKHADNEQEAPFPTGGAYILLHAFCIHSKETPLGCQITDRGPVQKTLIRSGILSSAISAHRRRFQPSM